MRLLLLFALLFLSSCSKLSVGVYWADTYLLSHLDNYFTMTSAEEEEAREDFLMAFKEVRRQEFPGLASLLEEIAGAVEREEVTGEKLSSWNGRAYGIFRTAGRRFEPLGQKLVAWQVDSNFNKFDEEFSERQEERAEKLATEKSRLKQAKKRVSQLVKETFGELNEEQERMVTELLRENPLQLENESRRKVFERFREARPDPGRRKIFVRAFFHDWDSLQLPEFIAARDAYQKRSRAVMLEVLAGANPEQKEHLVARFRKRAAELRKLSDVK